MGEVGGSFNERKNEITRKSRMCPTKNTTNFLRIELKEDVPAFKKDALTSDKLYFNSSKRSSDNSKNSN